MHYLNGVFIPNYIMSRTLNIFDTRWSIILPGIFAPFGVFLLTQFFKYIPDERIESVILESKSIFQVLRIAIIPTAKSGIIALIVLIFAENWNLVEQPLILINNELKRPLSVAFNSIIDQGRDIAFASSFFYMIPIVILYFLFEEQIVSGLTAWSSIGEVKE